jgi:hypothetical protein
VAKNSADGAGAHVYAHIKYYIKCGAVAASQDGKQIYERNAWNAVIMVSMCVSLLKAAGKTAQSR